jgi:glutathione S-transferase
MRTLYHFPLSPFSRKVRIVLAEKKLPFRLVLENFWERRREFLAMNPASQVPVLQEPDGRLYSDSTSICEYLEEAYAESPLLGYTPHERAEVRRISGWFNNKFYYEVTKYIVDEKVYKHFRRAGPPDSNLLRAGKANIHYHLEYITYLMRTRKYLAGDKFSLADITAASHISVLDYLGEVPWSQHDEDLRSWYAVVKSRPSFRPVLDDTVHGFKPAQHYAVLDF